MTERVAVTVPEAGEMVGIGKSQAWELVRAGVWPSFRIGRLRRVPVDAVREWVERQAKAAEDERLPWIGR